MSEPCTMLAQFAYIIEPLTRRAYLGAELPGDTEAFTRDGVRIAGVVDGGTAAHAGLRSGDMLVSLAGIAVHNLCKLGDGITRRRRSATAEIVIARR